MGKFHYAIVIDYVRYLLDNANKYTSNGILRLAAVQLHDEAIITVSDTGSGFKPEALQDFLNRNGTNTQSGNGSFIILQLLEFTGGRLEAVSATGRGTEFKIILPHRPVSIAQPASQNAQTSFTHPD